MSRATKLWIALLLGACVIATATTAGAGEDGTPTEIEAADAPTVPAIEPEQAEEIAELDRAARPDDELPARWEQAIDETNAERRGWGANPDLARHTAPGVWIMPGNGHVCIASNSPADGTGGFGCASNEDVERGLLAPTEVDANGNGIVTGVVPDGVASVEIVNLDGSTRVADVDHNTYRATIDANLKEVRFTNADGIRHVLPMEWNP